VNKINNISVCTVLAVYICTLYVLCDSKSSFLRTLIKIAGIIWKSNAG